MTRNCPQLYRRGAARAAGAPRSDNHAAGQLGRPARSAMARATSAGRHHPRAAVIVPASLAAAGLLASGCATASSQDQTASTAGHGPATRAEAEAATHGDGPAPPASSPCPASALRLSAGTGSGTAGSTYYPLDFTNVSRSACTLDGYPGASFVTGPGGSEIGTPAFRDPAVTSHVITLSPGSTAHAVLEVQLAQNYPAAICKPDTAHWLRVFPPGSTAALNLRFSAVTCTGKVPSGSTIGVIAVQPGTTGL